MDLTAAWLSSERLRQMLAGCLALVVGVVVGWLTLYESQAFVLAFVALPVAVLAFLRTLWTGLLAVLATATLLPYLVLPTGASVTPALLELVMIALIAATGAVVLLDRRSGVPVGAEMVWLLLLLGVVGAAFLLGLGRGYTTQTLHDFFKFILAFLTFWIVLQLIQSVSSARLVVLVLVALTTAAAAIGLALYAGGPGVTERVLLQLVPYGYPGSRIARFIEDDPARAMRGVGTSVDPNAFGGLLMLGFVLSAGQLLVRHRAMPLSVAAAAAAITGSGMLLTYSRGAWVGAVAGVAVIVVLRRRWLIVPGIASGAVVVLLGIGGGFAERLWLGFTLQDPATRLRLAEYRNAWEIIQRHPWFGVGFGDAPSIELQTGVSSIYLTIAQRTGLLGLAAFIVVVLLILWRSGRFAFTGKKRVETDLAVCVLGTFVAALTVGLVDHYFFNPQFPHMATLFWAIAGLLTAIPRAAWAQEEPEYGDMRGAVSSARRSEDGRREVRRVARIPETRKDPYHA